MVEKAERRIERLAQHTVNFKKVTTDKNYNTTMSRTKCPITSHVLDTTLGKPAKDLFISLEHLVPENNQWVLLGSGHTNEDGRLGTLLSLDHDLLPGTYRVTFDTAAYLEKTKQKIFYPEVSIVFVIENPTEHFHIPLLLNPFGYSTYRGS